jgi:transcriptional regulator with XRE-family HTH domain
MEMLILAGPADAFADRLRRLRLAAGLTQSELAEKAGLNLWGLSKLECSQREPRWSTVIALAEALGCTPNDFLPGEGGTPHVLRPPSRGKHK